MTGSRVSVILCTYNQRSFILDAVESALGQTHPDLELVIIDNGSTDGTRELLEPFRSQPNVRLLLHESNAAITTRMNEGIAASTGEFISILYGDDMYLPEKTARQLAVFARLGPEYGFVHSPGYRLDVDSGRRWVEHGLRESSDALRDLITRYHEITVNPVSPLIRRECLIRYPFDETVFTEGEDRFLFIALGYRFAYLDEPLVVMREHGRNLGKAYLLNYECALHVFAALERSPELPASLRPALTATRKRLTRRVGWELVRVGADPDTARGLLLRSLRDRIDAKALAGLVLTLVPRSVRSAANRLLSRIRRRQSRLEYRGEWR